MGIVKIAAAVMALATVDRELITGQQPMSAAEFGDILVKQLNAHRH